MNIYSKGIVVYISTLYFVSSNTQKCVHDTFNLIPLIIGTRYITLNYIL